MKRRPQRACEERQQLLQAVKEASRLTVPAGSEQAVIGDTEGDALDAILAAVAAAGARVSGFGGVADDASESGEGWIYSVD